MEFSERLKEFFLYAKQNNLFNEHSKVIVALSGGADSMVLLYFLHNLYLEGKLAAVHAFHLNHSLREEADDEERFVVEYCKKNNIPVTVKKENIREYARMSRISEETAGRQVRYHHLRSLKESLGYESIATAHHADDNAETIIMRLTRGTALRGMGGIRPRNDDIIRPVLYLTKDVIYNICAEENIPYVTDMSNFDDKYFRNRIRNTVLPALRDENPSFSAGLLKTSEIMREAWEYISSQAGSVRLEYENDKVICRVDEILKKDEFIISQIILNMCEKLTGAENVGYTHIKKVTSLLKNSRERWEYHLPGIRVVCGDGILTITKDRIKEKDIFYYYEMIPGNTIRISEAGIEVSTKIIKKSENFIINSYIKAVDYDKIKGKLFITPRQDNMKFRPVGRNMTKSVSKFLSDKKIPMHERNTMPVFRTEEGIVSVGCYEIDENYKITKDTKNILLISISKMQGEDNDYTQK